MGSHSTPHTLITGPNGFVGATMVAEALSQGHRITGSVRSLKAGKDLLAIHPEWDHSMIDFVEVPDYTTSGIFDEIFEKGDFDYVLHTAAPVYDNPANTEFEKHFEKPCVEGNLQILRSAAKFGKNVKAIAVTGTVNSITTGDDLDKRALSASEWLPIDRKEAMGTQNAYIWYCVAKKLAEKVIWKFVEEEKPSFVITNFMPGIISGPPLQHVEDVKKINWSTAELYSLFNGKNEVVPKTDFPAYIDVRDLAAAHIKALTTPAAANRRFVLALPFMYQDMAEVMKAIPQLKGRLAKDSDEVPMIPKTDMENIDKVFDIKWRTKKETFGDTARALLELENRA